MITTPMTPTVVAAFDSAEEARSAQTLLKQREPDVSMKLYDDDIDLADLSDGADVMGTAGNPRGGMRSIESEFHNKAPEGSGMWNLVKRVFAIDNNPTLGSHSIATREKETLRAQDGVFQNSRNVLVVTLHDSDQGRRVSELLRQQGGKINKQASTWNQPTA